MAVALAGQPVEPHGAKFRLIHYATCVAQSISAPHCARGEFGGTIGSAPPGVCSRRCRTIFHFVRATAVGWCLKLTVTARNRFRNGRLIAQIFTYYRSENGCIVTRIGERQQSRYPLKELAECSRGFFTKPLPMHIHSSTGPSHLPCFLRGHSKFVPKGPAKC